MLILVYGSKGWIGGQFVQLLEENKINFVNGKARCNDAKSIIKEIDSIKPTHIVSFIGRTHGKIGNRVYPTIDYLEEPGKLRDNVSDNIYSPLVLAKIAYDKKIHYTYLGTGCIFKYDDEHPEGFTEDSLPNFFGSSYSIVKGFTDQMMHLYEDSVLNLRIRMPITGEYNGRNFITKITKYEKICSIPNSMSVLPDLLPLVLDMMQNRVTGTMNLTNPGTISHNEILEMYKQIVDPSFVWKNFSQEEQRKILAAYRSNNLLNTTRLETLYPQVLPIQDAVKKYLYKYKESFDERNTMDKINLLVTGGYGFIGSNFINHYFPQNKINMLVNYDVMYYCANENNVSDKIRNDPKYKFIKGNLTDYNLVSYVLQEYKITHVIHFAAQSHVQNSFEDSIQYTYDNVLGTHTLLEAVRKYGSIKKFIHVSTDEVYGESMNTVEEAQKTEHSVLCPTNPYAATKAGAELIATSYQHSFKLPIIITRGNNVYGPNQYPEKLIPKFIKLLQDGKKMTIQGDGSSVRGFLHALDTAKAFQVILEKGEVGEIYNIGCDEGMEYSVMEIAQILVKMLKGTDEVKDYIEYIEDRPFNDQRYYISNEKLKSLGWCAEINLLDGLKDCIN
jgi:dTDP-glucose 4,6-dehydratase